MDGRLDGSEWTFWRASGDEGEKHSLPNYSLKCDWMRQKYWGMSLKGEKGKSMISDTWFHPHQPSCEKHSTIMKSGMRWKAINSSPVNTCNELFFLSNNISSVVVYVFIRFFPVFSLSIRLGNSFLLPIEALHVVAKIKVNVPTTNMRLISFSHSIFISL